RRARHPRRPRRRGRHRPGDGAREGPGRDPPDCPEPAAPRRRSGDAQPGRHRLPVGGRGDLDLDARHGPRIPEHRRRGRRPAPRNRRRLRPGLRRWPERRPAARGPRRTRRTRDRDRGDAPMRPGLQPPRNRGGPAHRRGARPLRWVRRGHRPHRVLLDATHRPGPAQAQHADHRSAAASTQPSPCVASPVEALQEQGTDGERRVRCPQPPRPVAAVAGPAPQRPGRRRGAGRIPHHQLRSVRQPPPGAVLRDGVRRATRARPRGVPAGAGGRRRPRPTDHVPRRVPHPRRRRHPAFDGVGTRHRLHRRARLPRYPVRGLLPRGRGGHGRLWRPAPLGQAPLPVGSDACRSLPGLGGVPLRTCPTGPGRAVLERLPGPGARPGGL
ncbi:uncharacterized protein METZ01_LOCUS125855, partial [marine metagenome]